MIPREQAEDIVASRVVLIVLGAVLAVTALGVAVAWLLTGSPGRASAADRPAEGNAVPGEVNAMETTPFAARAQGLEDRGRSEAWLSSYGWVDRPSGLVHIPIDRAIDLYLERAGRTGDAP